ncbi:hypothetical protein [Cellulomonas palmilytica]|uniref:hypothetical protein n=1 Tax=Cellulomonas palmilytica TaxID=2608402 RepID=UPI001F1F53EC|nr:hypothetical protein [Cellulomonas palmilytica]UJP40339.1 hypothetical protein F1D97_02045 [Cellulomonas palmilytica]
MTRWGVTWRDPLLITAAATLYVALRAYDPVEGALTTRWFSVWAGMLLISALVWVAVLREGLRRLRLRPRRPGAPRHGVRYVAIALPATAFVMAASQEARFVTHGSYVPSVLVVGLLALGWCTAAPWTLLVWRTRDDEAELARSIAAVGAPRWDTTTSALTVDVAAVHAAAATLRRAWEAIEASALALAVLLSSAVLNTAMLRLGAIASGATTATDSPTVFVLAYGAFFALVAAVLIGPVALHWRSQALALVDATLGEPPTGVPTAEFVDTRDRFLTHLGLRAGVLRTPVAALSVLAPLGTAFLAALVPTG